MEGEGSFDDVAATELPFCGDEEESQHLIVNNFVGDGDSQRTLALIAHSGNWGIPHTVLDGEKNTKRP